MEGQLCKYVSLNLGQQDDPKRRLRGEDTDLRKSLSEDTTGRFEPQAHEITCAGACFAFSVMDALHSSEEGLK